MNAIDITSSIDTERLNDLGALKAQLARDRAKRVVAEPEESMAVLDRLMGKFSGRELATALSAEGFGDVLDLRAAVLRLDRVR